MFRAGVVVTAGAVLIWLTAILGHVVRTVTYGFSELVRAEAIASKVNAALVLPHLPNAASAPSAKASESAKTHASSASDPPKQPPQAQAEGALPPQKVEIVLKGLGELRDLFLPVIALVSLLTVAVVVILVTMLKASFAQSAASEKADESMNLGAIPIPLIEAIKSLLDTLKGLTGK